MLIPSRAATSATRVAPFGDLKDRVPLEVLGEVRFAHRGPPCLKIREEGVQESRGGSFREDVRYWTAIGYKKVA